MYPNVNCFLDIINRYSIILVMLQINPPISDIRIFCESCSHLGYNNNSSLKAMKYDWCLDNGGAWWGYYRQNKLVSIAGSHPFKDGFRFLFRGAQLVTASSYLSKKHLTSIPWAIIMPEQISWASGVLTEETPAYITTNISHDESGKMNRTHQVLQLLKKQHIVEYIKDEEIYGVIQSIWRLNIGEYYGTLD